MALDRSITLDLLRQTPKVTRVQVQRQLNKSFQTVKNRMIAELKQKTLAERYLVDQEIFFHLLVLNRETTQQMK